jgi:pimeloyl-ACP methyl ester carboxylesterase
VFGVLGKEAHKRENAEECAMWEKTGWKEEESRSKPGMIKRLPWSHIIDRTQYDLFPNASKLTMPVMPIVGEKDTLTPPDHVRIFLRHYRDPRSIMS